MGLIFEVVMGMVFGVVVMAGWNWMMRYRSNKRVSKAIDIKLITSLGREDLKKIYGDAFSEWISFPEFEQVNWLNKELSKLWPYVADASELAILKSVEPLLEKYHPSGFSSMEFSKLTLGTVAPKIEGIKVQSKNPSQIIMDIDLKWGGNPSIILAVTAANVAPIPVQLKDFKVFTVIRVIFQLAEEFPCISAVAVALLSEPKPVTDYTLKLGGGSITAIPGISDMIKYTIDSIVTDTLEWPNRIVVPIGGSTPVDTSDLELKPQGKLTVTIVKGNDLKTQEFVEEPELCTVLYIRRFDKIKTTSVQDNLNPVWNETYELIAEDKETQSLILEVFVQYNWQDKQIGIAKLPLIDLEPEITKEIDLRLLPSLDTTRVKDEKDRGSLTIEVHYHVFSKEEQDAAVEAEKKIEAEKKMLTDPEVVIESIMGVVGAAGLVGSGHGKRAKLARLGLGAGISIAGSVGSGLIKTRQFMADFYD